MASTTTTVSPYNDTTTMTSSPLDNIVYPAAGAVGALSLILFIICVICCVTKKKTPRRENATPQVVVQPPPKRGKAGAAAAPPTMERRRAQPNDYQREAPKPAARQQPPKEKKKQRPQPQGPDMGILGEAIASEKKDSIISEKRLELKENIGSGVFGDVYRGVLLDQNMRNPQNVAVKTINEDSRTDKTIKSFLQEAFRMQGFKHRNVLTMIALTYRGKVPFVILPFMENGDLKTYVNDAKNKFTPRQLVEYGIQIAEGMAYLAEYNFVHRDLAARNCLVDKAETVKIADFGLARDLHVDDYYVIQDLSTPLPVKWMAPECIKDRKFSLRSDIWSFGVVLWEVMTRGQKPYPGLTNAEVMKFVKAGRRLPAPAMCPGSVYKLMTRCWSEDSARRPPFTQIVKELNEMLDKGTLKKKQKPAAKAQDHHVEPLYYNLS